MKKETDLRNEIFNVGETILLDGEPLNLVTPAGVEAWIEKGVKHSYRYDQVRDPLDGQMKYRCLYKKDGTDVPFVLVSDPDTDDGRVILFDQKPEMPSLGL
ncbi:MAG: hypothetical protein ACRBB0_21770 [Pelagimonas sp.]|uniref:hypothetical protein n=1 Tax=Roseobacteraceae TaxID=2854170 RepID=UPI003747239E